jgi:short-subunit dehydrogenase
MGKNEIVVVSGLGNATGTGASVARLFASEGFRVALVSRPRHEVDSLKAEINKAGGQVE